MFSEDFDAKNAELIALHAKIEELRTRMNNAKDSQEECLARQDFNACTYRADKLKAELYAIAMGVKGR